MRARQIAGTTTVVAIIAAALAGAVWANANGADGSGPLSAGPFEGVVRVVEGPFLTQNGQRFIARRESPLDIDICVYGDAAPRPHVGDLVFASGRLTLPEDLSAVGRAALRSRDCAAQLSLDKLIIVREGTGLRSDLSRFRTGLSDFLMQSAPGDTGALLSGLVTGDDGGLSDDASNAFLDTGTTHITAISGANFAVLVMLLGVMSSGAMRRSLWFICVATGVIWLYASMVGLQPSALRAALLATAVLIGRWLGRTPDLLTLTLLLASVQILWRPSDFGSLAFQLSIAATVALIVVFDGSARLGGRSWPLALVLSVLAAQLATLPVLAARLGSMSGVGLLANLVIGPLASIAFPVALVGGLIGRANFWSGEVVMLPAIWIGDAMIAIVTVIDAHLPGTVQLGEPVPIAIGVLAIACWSMIFAMSGDLRRMSRHCWAVIRNW